jgi:hypothetical protein
MTASEACLRKAGGVVPKPWAARSCHDCMPVARSKGRARYTGCRVVVPHAIALSPPFVIRE